MLPGDEYGQRKEMHPETLPHSEVEEKIPQKTEKEREKENTRGVLDFT